MIKALVHKTQSLRTIQAMKFFDWFKYKATAFVLPLKQMSEKSVSAYVENNQSKTTDAFEDFSLDCREFENVRHGFS